MLRKTVLCAIVWFAACQAWAAGFPEDRANNWHRWRGPEATGVAPSGNPPITLVEDTNIKWKVWAYPDRLEVRGLVSVDAPMQVEQAFNSGWLARRNRAVLSCVESCD